jgi:formyltetrahydrofolate-dependent phosphoribosylglycinamide formyltransferase
MRKRVAVLISGRGSNLAALLGAARSSEYPAQITYVISNRADAGGLALARLAGVHADVISHREHPDRAAHEAAIDAALRAHFIDIVCLAGYMRLLTPLLVGRWAGRMLNIHPSLLPHFPGLHTHRRALEAGVAWHGCTVHLVSEDMDAGPILGQAAVPVLPGDTEDSLAARVLLKEHVLYPWVLNHFARGESSACECA